MRGQSCANKTIFPMSAKWSLTINCPHIRQMLVHWLDVTAINKDKTHTRTAIQCMGFEKSVLIVPQCGLKKAIITLQTNLFKGGFLLRA